MSQDCHNSPTELRAVFNVTAMLAVMRLLAPAFLKRLNKLWFKFGLLLHRAVNHIVMFAVFALGCAPYGEPTC